MTQILLNIQEPLQPPKARPSLTAFLELGFRPLYLAGCSWAIISIFIWIFFPNLLTGPLMGFMWHAHEMLWGFIGTIAVGFLFTAGNNWTGINPASGKFLAMVCSSWLLARIGYLIINEYIFLLAVGAESIFYLTSASALLRVFLKTKNNHNLGTAFLVFGLGIANLIYLYTAVYGDLYQLIHSFSLGLICMSMIALLIARRVIPFFAMRGVTGLTISRHTKSGHIQLTLTVLGLIFLLIENNLLASIFLFACATLTLYQLISWRPWQVRKVPLLWVLYLGYFFIGCGLAGFAGYLLLAYLANKWAIYTNLFWLARAAWSIHLLGIGGFAVLIIGMVTRTSLGHLGQPLKTSKIMVASFIFIILSALLRLASLSFANSALIFLHCAAVAWIMGFALFLWHFVPLLIRPRLNQVKQRNINDLLKIKKT